MQRNNIPQFLFVFLFLVLFALFLNSIASFFYSPQAPVRKALPQMDYESVNTGLHARSSAQKTLYPVIHVVDGDTLDIAIHGVKTRLRLIGINTPETVDPRRKVECFGKEASAKAKELLSGKEVSIEFDPSQGTYDKYGRLLVYVYLPDGTSFNKQMISEGYAYEYTYRLPYKYQAEYKQAQHDAETAARGLWADGACTKNE